MSRSQERIKLSQEVLGIKSKSQHDGGEGAEPYRSLIRDAERKLWEFERTGQGVTREIEATEETDQAEVAVFIAAEAATNEGEDADNENENENEDE